jgi:hypothetical protein
MALSRSFRVLAPGVCLLLSGAPAWSQPAAAHEPVYPGDRPNCISFFLKNDHQLTLKQRGCDFLQNRFVTPTSLAGAAWSAGFSQMRESSEDRGKGMSGFMTRFSTNQAQSSMKATAEFLTGIISREDPRRAPPYLAFFDPNRLPVRPERGFWNRTRRAIMSNFISYRCVAECTKAEDVKATFAAAKIAGSFASGFSSMLWAPDRLNTPGRALRRTASAYGGTFANNLFIEFRPEIAAFGKRVARVLAVR